MSAPDYFGRLLLAVDGYNAKFPGGNTPFQIMTRLCEEAGELAAVNEAAVSAASLVVAPVSHLSGAWWAEEAPQQ